MRAHSILALAAALASAHARALPPIVDGDPAPPPLPAPIASDSASRFEVEEKTLAAAVASASPDQVGPAREALAAFYESHGLCVEALAALDEPDALSARCNYALGRYSSVVGQLSDQRPQALRAMALARLGAFKRAAVDFDALDQSDGAADQREFVRLKAETLLAAGRAKDAKAALRSDGGDAGEALIAARADLALGGGGAVERLHALADGRDQQAAVRAALALLVRQFKDGGVSSPDALQRALTLELRWSGGAFEREWLEAAASFSRKDRPLQELRYLRELVARHGASDAAQGARGRIAAALARLASDDKIAPRDLAQAFYESIGFMPAGAAGDALIRQLTERLVRLDLLKEAAELLEHQVFARLRGVERSRTAAELGQIYLDDQRPGEALRVMRSTRIAGLDATTLARRKLIEATALDRTGASAAALEFLSGVEDSQALWLRADIEWRLKDWAASAASYRKIVETFEGSPDERTKAAAVRAGAAYATAGDSKGLAELYKLAKSRPGLDREAAILSSMDARAGASLLAAYRQLGAQH